MGIEEIGAKRQESGKRMRNGGDKRKEGRKVKRRKGKGKGRGKEGRKRC